MFFVVEITVVLTYVASANALLAAVFGGAFVVYYIMYFLAINVTIARKGVNPYVHFATRIYRPMLGIAIGLISSVGIMVVFPSDYVTAVIALISFVVLCFNHMRDPHYW